MKRFNQIVTTWLAAVVLTTVCSLACAADWQGTRLGFVGRVVQDLDRSPQGRDGLSVR